MKKGYIVILWDGLSAHRAGAVKEFVQLHSDRLSIYRLPAYCPDFNPVEWLWAEVKWNRLKGYCPEDSFRAGEQARQHHRVTQEEARPDKVILRR